MTSVLSNTMGSLQLGTLRKKMGGNGGTPDLANFSCHALASYITYVKPLPHLGSSTATSAMLSSGAVADAETTQLTDLWLQRSNTAQCVVLDKWHS